MAPAKKKNNKIKILSRYALIIVMFSLLSIAIVVKLFQTTVVEAEEWNKAAREQMSRTKPIPPERGNILSDNGSILACNVRVYDIKIDCGHVAFDKIEGGIPWKEVDALADSLDRLYPLVSNLKELPPAERAEKSWKKYLYSQFNKPLEQRSHTAVVKRKGSLEDFAHVRSLPLLKRFIKRNGYRNPVYYEDYDIRINPYGNMGRRSIGKVNQKPNGEVHGYSGVEYDLDSLLYGQTGIAKKVTMTSGLSDWVMKPAMRGYDLQTTFNIDLQDMLEQELTAVCDSAKASWGTAILMEVATGEIKAIANVQQMDDGTYGEALNRAVRGFEPGSVMKPISLMIAFEDGLVHGVDDTVDCSPFQRTSDPHGGTIKNMKQVIEMSSNTGIARVIFRGYERNPEKFYDRLASIGFFEPMRSGIDYQETPQMRRLTEIDDRGRRRTMTERHLDLARQAYGYTSTIPPIYTLAIYNAIANGGRYVRPHVVKRMTNDVTDSVIPISYIRDRICSEETARKVRECLLQPVWGEHGTARAVRDNRVKIAGKTGTAYPMMSDKGGGYDHSRRRYAFAGFFPYDKPKYSCMALILAPSGTSANRTSGQVVKGMALKMYARGMLDNVSTFSNAADGSRPLLVRSSHHTSGQIAAPLHARGTRTYKAGVATKAGRVPDVTGYDVMSAVKMLESQGLNVVLSGRGKVIRQSPAPGSPIKKGTKIILTLSV